jgi:O-antigen ligase
LVARAIQIVNDTLTTPTIAIGAPEPPGEPASLALDSESNGPVCEWALPVCAAGVALGCYLSNALHTASLLAGLSVLLLRIVRHGRSALVMLPGLELPIALYVVSFFVSATWGVQPSVSFAYSTELKRIGVAYLIASSLRTRRQVEFVTYMLLAGACLTSACAYYQHIFGGELTCLRVTRFYRPYELTQPFGFASTCNDLAELLSLAACFSGGMALFGQVSAMRRCSFGVVAIVATAGMLRSLSRSGLVGTLSGFLVIGGLVRPRRVVALFAVLVCIYPLIPQNLRVRHYQFFELDVVPNRFRVRMVELSLEMARNHLPIGIGRRNFEEVHRQMRRGSEEISPNAHNNYLNVLVEQGILGLVALCWFQVQLLLYGLRLMLTVDRSDRTRAYAAGIMTALTAFIVAGLFDFYWGFSLPVTVMWIFVGILYAIGQGRVAGFEKEADL